MTNDEGNLVPLTDYNLPTYKPKSTRQLVCVKEARITQLEAEIKQLRADKRELVEESENMILWHQLCGGVPNIKRLKRLVAKHGGKS